MITKLEVNEKSSGQNIRIPSEANASNGPSPKEFLFEGRDENLDELRQLLIGPEQKALRKLQERLDNPKKRAYDISRVLPQAMVLCSSQNAALAKELTPQMDKLINASISKNTGLSSTGWKNIRTAC